MESADQIDRDCEELDQLLVAYLDGELDQQQRREIENRLMEDGDCKRRLRLLQQSFDMLDELPRNTVNADFARTTVEMIALNVSQEMQVAQRRRPIKISATLVSLLVTTIACFAVGALIATGSWRKSQNQQWEDLAVAEHLRGYSQVKTDNDLRFFEDLSRDSAWQELISLRRELEELPQRSKQTRLAALAIDKRSSAVAMLPPERRRDLQIQLEQFHAQSTERQTELRQVMQQIQQRTDADALTDTLVSYVDWLDSLPQSRVAQLHATPTSTRLDAVHQIIQEDQHHGRDQISGDDIVQLYDALLDIANSRIQALNGRLTPEQKSELDKRLAELKFKATPVEPAQRLPHLMVRNLLTPRFFDKRGPNDGLRMPPLTAPERQQLLDVLSERATQSLQSVEDPRAREGRLFAWAWVAMRKRSPLQTSGYDPAEAYENVDDDLRERIDLLEPSSALKTLRGRGFADWRNEGRNEGAGGRPGDFDPRDRQHGRPPRRDGDHFDDPRSDHRPPDRRPPGPGPGPDPRPPGPRPPSPDPLGPVPPGTDPPGLRPPGSRPPGSDLPDLDSPGSDLPGSDLPGSVPQANEDGGEIQQDS